MNLYAPVVDNDNTVTVNRAALLAIGCDEREADTFANRTYSSLPAWLKKRIKAATKSRQDEPRKLRPQAGELQFYISPYRFPRKQS